MTPCHFQCCTRASHPWLPGNYRDFSRREPEASDLGVLIFIPAASQFFFIIIIIIYPLDPLVLRAATKELQLCLSWAIIVSVPKCVWGTSFLSHLFSARLSWASLICAIPLVSSEGLFWCLSLSPSATHVQAISRVSWLIIVAMSSCFQQSSRSWLEIFFGQNMWRILQRLVVWKDDNLVRSYSIICQQSDPYRSVDRKQQQKKICFTIRRDTFECESGVQF